MLLGSNPDWCKRLKDRKFMLDRIPLFRVGHGVMRSKNETQRPQALKLCRLSFVGFGVHSNLAQILERKSQSSCFNFAANAFSATESFKVGRF